MKFRPCIDIHNGKVKQIVGSSLTDDSDDAKENFVSNKDASYYAKLYKNYNLNGGHIIILNHKGSDFYEATKKQAINALEVYPGGMQIGGGITSDNAKEYLDAGASHVIVTSYVFKDGKINFKNLEKLSSVTGYKRLVLDLSCKKKNGEYYIVTDRWSKFTDVKVNQQTLDMLMNYCSEFLVHAADVEGKKAGIDSEIIKILSEWGKIPITYAGGITDFDSIDQIKQAGKGKLDFTIGSALDIFGGTIEFTKVTEYVKS